MGYLLTFFLLNWVGIDKAVDAVVDVLEENVQAFKDEKETELSDLQAKYDVLKAGDSNASGADANLDSDEIKLTAADQAAKNLVNSLSDSDKLMFSKKED